MGGNTFYSNAEAYAFEILNQKLFKEAQKSAQQTLMELAALKSFMGQGQLLYCIPFGGHNHQPSVFPFPLTPFLSPDPPFAPPDPHHHPIPPPPQPPPLCSPSGPSPPPAPPPAPLPAPLPAPHHQSILHVNVKSGQPKPAPKSGSDDCNLGKDGIEVVIDLKEYMPAEINLDVEEKSVEIRARHVDAQGSKTFSRRYDLPACIVPDSVKCILSHDGVLMFSAAWLKME